MSLITMEKLKSGMCRWPFGSPDEKDFHFCGDQCDPDSPYCDKHMLKAQAPARKPKT